MMKRVLVTGAPGFIGSACLPDLLAREYEIHAVASPKREIPDDLLELDGIEWRRSDLLDPSEFAPLLERTQPSHLLHLAWHAPGSWDAPENWRWVDVSLALLGEFIAGGGTRAVVTGTSAEYDYHQGDGVCSEKTTPLQAQSIYGQSKRQLFERAIQLFEGAPPNFAWARLFSLYGPREQYKRLVPSVTRALLRSEPAKCTDGLQKRDFLHVDDAARALVALLDSNVTGPLNIASGNAIPVRDVVEQVVAETGNADLVRYGALPTRAVDPPLMVADTKLLHEALGFEPEISLQEGIARTVSWWRSELSQPVIDR
jgi:nucleoside-diphosphate-sugar epimerase